MRTDKEYHRKVGTKFIYTFSYYVVAEIFIQLRYQAVFASSFVYTFVERKKLWVKDNYSDRYKTLQNCTGTTRHVIFFI